MMSDAYPIVELDDFLTPFECGFLIKIAKPRLAKSRVWDVASGSEKEDDYRVSEQVFFGRGENLFVRRIEEKIAKATSIPVIRGEGIQVLHYFPGGYYKPHNDFFDPAFPGNQSQLQRGGQRIATFMMYLADVEEGGCTNFPNIGYRATPKMGRAIFWANITPDGNPDPDALHEAEPVIRGEKWAAQKWFREREFV